MKQYQRKIEEYKSLIQKEYIRETAVHTVKEQWQKFHHFLHHRGDLCGSCKGVRFIKCNEKGVDVSGKQTGTHPGKAEQKEFSLPLSHAHSSDQQG